MPRSLAPKRSPQPRDMRSDSFSHLSIGEVSEVNSGPNASKTTLPRVFTKIHAIPREDLEEGIILESMSVQQSTYKKRIAD